MATPGVANQKSKMSDTDFERRFDGPPEQPMKNAQSNFGQMAVGAAVTLVVGLVFSTMVEKPMHRADALQEQRIVTLEKFAEASRDDRASLRQQVNTQALQIGELSRRREDDRNEFKQAMAEIKADMAEIKDILSLQTSRRRGASTPTE